MASLLTTLTLTLVVAQPSDSALALADRQDFAPQEWGYLYYLTANRCDPRHRDDLVAATKLIVASSSRQTILERCTPELIAPGLMRIDLRDLEWSHHDWHHVLERYCYSRPATGQQPLVVRADWLIVQLTDSAESDAQQRLMFGRKNIPETEDEWLSALGIKAKGGVDNYANYGIISGQSRIAVSGTRLAENRPDGQRGGVWITRDVRRLNGDTDPLENLLGFEHDGSELIARLPKLSLETGRRVHLQVYALSDGDGKMVREAPGDLVVDHQAFRGRPVITASGSCVQCHATGLNEFQTNELRRLIVDGVDVYAAGKDKQQQIEAYYLGELEQEIQRHNEDFAAAVRLVTGLDAADAAAAFQRSVQRYDTPLDLESTARELRVTADAWSDALAFASARKAPLGARLAGLAHGHSVPRRAWEERYYDAQQYVQEYVQEWKQ